MEVCVDNIQSVINASNGGAMRLELCTSLSEGGLTPTVGFLKQANKLVRIPIFVMIRPRGGGFVYNNDEVEIMKKDMRLLKENGADGFVLGVLTAKRTVDVNLCKQFIDLAAPLPVTFHRAFDYTIKPFEALEEIISLGFKRILTSGQQPTAEIGMKLIRKLIVTAKGRIIIMPGSGINEFNLGQILVETKAIEFHGSAKEHTNNIASADNLSYYSSKSGLDNEQLTCICTDEEAVRRMVKIAQETFDEY